MSVIASVTDPQGRVVELTDTQWAHIVTQRGDRVPSKDLVLRAINEPESVYPGRQANELWFYLATEAPSRWLRVVVAYEGDRGFVVTAFPRRTKP